ncbi:enoyl-CoA hydratase/isomerase family protein [Haloplanus litoreus]|uniref:Enoyl-CoA hydratase/isomerase family protein n=1 Tax=Haloplanus litoreus TaxID=767515 RepID=A0ABD6A2A0_9EURY
MVTDDTYQYLDYEDDGAVRTVRIDNPPVNLLTSDLKAELFDVVERIEADPEARCLLLRGQKRGTFSGGRDLNESRSWIESTETGAEIEDAWNRGRKLIHEMLTSSAVIVAVVEGAAVGGGAELLLHCDVVFASADAEIGFPEIERGLFPGTGAIELLPDLVGRRTALAILLTGDVYPASEWAELGVVTDVCEPPETYAAATAFAETVAGRPAPAVAAIKRTLEAYRTASPEAARRRELALFKEVFTSPEAAEGVRAFFEDRDPDFGSHE